MEYVKEVYANYNWSSRYSHRKFIKGTGEHGNKKTSGNHPNYYNLEIEHNTEKSPGDLRRYAVTQSPVKDHQFTPM